MAPFALPFELTRASIYSGKGALLAELPAAGLRRRYELPFAWDPGRTYRVVVEGPAGKLAEKTITIEHSLVPDISGSAFDPRLVLVPKGPLRAAVQIPFGQPGFTFHRSSSSIRGQLQYPTYPVAASPGSTLQMGLQVECVRQAYSPFEFRFDFPASITVSCDDPRVKLEAGRLTWSGELELEHDYEQVMVNIQIPPNFSDDVAILGGRFVDADGIPRQLSIELHTRAEPGKIELVDVTFPSDSAGEPRPEQLADAVVLADPVWSRVHRLLRPTAPIANEHEPVGWQAVQLKNDGALPVSVRIESEVAEGNDSQPLLDFAPTTWIAPTESPTSEHLLAIPPHSTATAVLPLFARREVRPGRYERRLRIFPVGSTQEIAQTVRPLDVIRGDAAVSISVLAALVGSLIAVLLVAWRGRRVVAGIGVEGLATIGMMAAVQFAAAYVFRIGTHVLAGLLGPFAIFVTGLGNEGVSGMLMAATITLVPRVGAASLTLATLWLLNSLFTGQFGLVDIEFVILSCLACELTLALLGVTTTSQIRRPARHAPWSMVLRVALALGSAKALALYLDLCLVQVLYRLYFAPWYVLAVALCVGLGYGATGAAAGTVLGYQLRRTAG